MEGSGSPENLGQAPRKETPKQGESLGRKTIEVNGREWSYLEYGNLKGKPILVLHGWTASPEVDIPLLRAFAGDVPESYGFRMLSEKKPESAQALARNIEALKGKYRIIDPYQPGTRETKPLKDISYDAMADEVASFQKTLGMESAIMFCVSAGGRIGIKLAGRYPELVKMLVLQGTPTKPEDVSKKSRDLLRRMTFGPVPYILYSLDIPYKTYRAEAMKSEEFDWTDKESQDALLEAFKTAQPKTTIKLGREIVGENIERDIKKVGCPVIVVDGVNGQLVPFVRSKEAARKFHRYIPPDAERVTRTDEGVLLAVTEAFGKQGHSVVNTAPEILAVLVDKMFKKLLELTHANENSGPTSSVESR